MSMSKPVELSKNIMQDYDVLLKNLESQKVDKSLGEMIRKIYEESVKVYRENSVVFSDPDVKAFSKTCELVKFAKKLDVDGVLSAEDNLKLLQLAKECRSIMTVIFSQGQNDDTSSIAEAYVIKVFKEIQHLKELGVPEKECEALICGILERLYIQQKWIHIAMLAAHMAGVLPMQIEQHIWLHRMTTKLTELGRAREIIPILLMAKNPLPALMDTYFHNIIGNYYAKKPEELEDILQYMIDCGADPNQGVVWLWLIPKGDFALSNFIVRLNLMELTWID